jgi:chorismate mutase
MPDKDKLTVLRDQIDQIDAQVLRLLAQRIRLIDEIAVLKEHMNKPVVDHEREADLHKRLEALCRDEGLDTAFITKIWQLILTESYQIQHGKK